MLEHLKQQAHNLVKTYTRAGNEKRRFKKERSYGILIKSGEDPAG